MQRYNVTQLTQTKNLAFALVQTPTWVVSTQTKNGGNLNHYIFPVKSLKYRSRNSKSNLTIIGIWFKMK